MTLVVFALRIVAFGSVAAMARWADAGLAQSIYYAVLLGHYVLQVLYSRTQVRELAFGNARVVRWSCLVALFAFAELTPWLPMTVFFGVHFVLSEVYGTHHASFSKAFVAMRMLASAGLYAAFLQDEPPFDKIHPGVFNSAFSAGAFGMLAFVVHDARRGVALARNPKLLACLYELLGFGCVLLVPPYVATEFLGSIIFAHLLWWSVFPLTRLRISATRARVLTYVLLTVVVTGAFFVFTPHGPRPLPSATWHVAAMTGGNLHITLSFALSRLNPSWVNQLFQARPARRDTPIDEEGSPNDTPLAGERLPG